MTSFDFFISNVFAESAWGGNPLAIVPNADALSDTQMQRIARQFNLSETVFICASSEHAARLRIFTPEYEMAFAGHPTIGAAAWLHAARGLPDQFTLHLPAKVVTIKHTAGVFSLTASGYTTQPCALNTAELAAALGLTASEIAHGAMWLNVGTWQLLVPTTHAAAIERVRPNLAALQDAAIEYNRANVYVWHEADGQVTCRYFFNTADSVVEDPGTGSACTNLGAWAHLHGRAPLSWRVTQAASIGRPNHLYLNVSAAGEFEVGGRVMPFAQGTMTMPTESQTC
ncbi:MAG: PhzF family phenazine biosynthesis protein [Formosimonas sp.]